jgi:hypothetical protein
LYSDRSKDVIRIPDAIQRWDIAIVLSRGGVQRVERQKVRTVFSGGSLDAYHVYASNLHLIAARLLPECHRLPPQALQISPREEAEGTELQNKQNKTKTKAIPRGSAGQARSRFN